MEALKVTWNAYKILSQGRQKKIENNIIYHKDTIWWPIAM
jgi:hypothetical protein